MSRIRRLAWRSFAAALAAFLLGMAAAGFAAPGENGQPAAPSPTRYAVVIRKSDNAQLLLKRGETVAHPQDRSRFAVVEEIRADALVVRTPAGRSTVPVGSKVPGPTGFVFARTAMVARLEYRLRAVEHLTRPEPMLVGLEGETAILEVEVLRPSVPVSATAAAVSAPGAPTTAEARPSSPPPTRAVLDEQLLARVAVEERDPGRYEVKRSDFRAVLENAGRVLTELRPFVLPSFSLAGGIEYKISSAASDGVLGPRGFTVYDPKMATRAGIEIGDRILNVNGRAVDGVASLYRIYQELRGNAAVASVEVELERAGQRLRKTYQMR